MKTLHETAIGTYVLPLIAAFLLMMAAPVGTGGLETEAKPNIEFGYETVTGPIHICDCRYPVVDCACIT